MESATGLPFKALVDALYKQKPTSWIVLYTYLQFLPLFRAAVCDQTAPSTTAEEFSFSATATLVTSVDNPFVLDE